MYIYYRPINGFNDIMGRVMWFMQVCQLYNFILLVDGERGTYRVDFSNYFTFPQEYIITDGAAIHALLAKHPITLTVPHTDFSPPISYFGEVMGDHKMIYFQNLRHFPCSYPIFRQLIFATAVKDECRRRRSLLTAKYLGIQVRNTDYTCDYPAMYETNKAMIHSFPQVYLATDCPKVLQFFKSKGVNVQNFITFQLGGRPLHKSAVPSSVKFMDLLCDIYLIGMAETVLSVSRGGFIQLMLGCNQNKGALATQFGPTLCKLGPKNNM
jgi:hypothetical protein